MSIVHCTVEQCLLLRGCSRKNIFCQKIFDNFLSFQATEMVLTHTSKWGRIQPEIQIQADQAACQLDRSLKPLEVSRDALRAEIT